MNYMEFREILNRHIFDGEKEVLLNKIAKYPERFIGLFRPTKPKAKIFQYLLQSHEIKFGDALEEFITRVIEESGFKNLEKKVVNGKRELLLDQYFKDEKKYYFVEHKVRDDHDSSKKRGQIENFEKKLEVLYERHRNNLVGVMYFIDPLFLKNKSFYKEELAKLSKFYEVELHLFYGKEFFEFLGNAELWDQIMKWLVRWKDELSDFPEIDFDKDPDASYEEIKDVKISVWRKLMENEELWEYGVVQVLFSTGETLKLILQDFGQRRSAPYRKISRIIERKIEKYY